jgi:hypothetical protein
MLQCPPLWQRHSALSSWVFHRDNGASWWNVLRTGCGIWKYKVNDICHPCCPAMSPMSETPVRRAKPSQSPCLLAKQPCPPVNRDRKDGFCSLFTSGDTHIKCFLCPLFKVKSGIYPNWKRARKCLPLPSCFLTGLCASAPEGQWPRDCFGHTSSFPALLHTHLYTQMHTQRHMRPYTHTCTHISTQRDAHAHTELPFLKGNHILLLMPCPIWSTFHSGGR